MGAAGGVAGRSRTPRSQGWSSATCARKEAERAEEALALVDALWARRADRRVSDAQWAAIAALLPPAARTGRRRADDRRTLEAILHVRRTGRVSRTALPLRV